MDVCQGWRDGIRRRLCSVERIFLRANSIGAYFSMRAFAGEPMHWALFVSSIVDMERLIFDMMTRGNVGKAELRKHGEIPADFGEILSWHYLCWVREHPLDTWQTRTAILCAEEDKMTSRKTMAAFASAHYAALTHVENGEHWFHMPTQLNALAAWEQNYLKRENWL